jgi:hypothetical protein
VIERAARVVVPNGLDPALDRRLKSRRRPSQECVMAGDRGRGSAGNVIAAICSLLIPGLGQLVQGRVLAAIVWFVVSIVVWAVSFGFLGWVAHVLACVDAARWKPRD